MDDDQKNLVIEGRIENGVTKVPSFRGIPERTQMRVEILKDQPLKTFPWENEEPGDGTPFPTLAESLREFIGIAEGPGDMAVNRPT